MAKTSIPGNCAGVGKMVDYVYYSTTLWLILKTFDTLPHLSAILKWSAILNV